MYVAKTEPFVSAQKSISVYTWIYVWDIEAKRKSGSWFGAITKKVCFGMFDSEQMKEDRKFLKKWNWSTVLMDEAHLLKDRGSYRSKRLRDVAQKAKQRVMLTGTPLQNDLQVFLRGQVTSEPQGTILCDCWAGS